MKGAPIVVQTEEQRSNELVLSLLVPAEACDDAISGARMLDLDHRALAGFVDARRRLGNDAIEAGALELLQPFRGDPSVASHWGYINRRVDGRERLFQQRSPLGLRQLAHVAIVGREDVEGHKGGWRLFRQFRHARGSGVQPKLQQIEIKAVGRDDDDFPVDDQSRGKLFEERVVKFRKVPVERPEVAALNVDVVLPTENDRSEAVPLRLVEETAVSWKRVGELREHRLDGRWNGEHYSSRSADL